MKLPSGVNRSWNPWPIDSLPGYVVQIVVVAALYVALARLGQIFAIPPGNITPIWLPSGVMLAVVALGGPRLLPAVFIGAFFGNTWAYLELHSLTAIAPGVVAGL